MCDSRSMTTTVIPSLMNQDSGRIFSSRALRPLEHQVAGQSLMLHFDELTICKCLIHREYQFYKSMPKCLQPFVPEFRGVIQLYVPESSSQDCPIGCSCTRRNHKGVHLDWSQNCCPSTDEMFEGFNLDASRLKVLRKTTRRTGVGINENLYCIIWLILKENDFMLLEDLITPYKNPCILDLKIGVRQHGDDAPPDKAAYQMKKCKATTSASLGLRLCGMKRYDTVSDEFETRDRMYGRQLNDEDIKAQIVKFLFNGQDFRADLINSILYQLKNLKNVIEQLDGYRFYSSSLLIIYEGTVSQEQHSEESRYHQCDQHRSDYLLDSQLVKDENIYCGDKVSDNVDSEDNIQKTVVIDDDMPQMCSEEAFDTSQCSNDHRLPHCSAGKLCRYHYNNATSEIKETSLKSSNNLLLQKQLNFVDIKLVDFAHATFDGFLDDTVKHYGPDHGFLLGVNTLLEIFMELKDRSVFY